MAPRYKVTLTKEERNELEAISTKGTRAARTVISSRALLLLDAGEFGPKWIVARVAEALGKTTRSLEHLKKRFIEEGLNAAIERKRRETPPRAIQFGGEFEGLSGFPNEFFEKILLLKNYPNTLGLSPA